MNEKRFSPATRREAFLGLLPFLAFGIAIVIQLSDHLYNIRGHDFEIGVYALILVGMLAGWIRGFPLWSYSYLAWSLILAWSNSDIKVYGKHWGYQAWIPLGVVVLLALLWTRSLQPVIQFFRDIWDDWYRLTLVMFSLGAWAWAYMVYDENHHPYLTLFILASALAAAIGVWFFLRSTGLKGRLFPLVGSYVSMAIISGICYSTWDRHAYYGIPKVEVPWYQALRTSLLPFSFWFLVIFWPILLSLIRSALNRKQV